MRTPRIILDDGACAYHCISRVVGQEKLFTDAIKEKGTSPNRVGEF